MNIETLNDLIEALQELAECDDKEGNQIGDLPVRIAYQNSWPLAGRVSAVTVCKKDGKTRVWIAESPVSSYIENPYAPRDAWEGGIEGTDWEADWESDSDWDEEDE